MNPTSFARYVASAINSDFEYSTASVATSENDAQDITYIQEVPASNYPELQRESRGDLASSTERREALPLDLAKVTQIIEGLFWLGRDERFEDGVESEFSRSLVSAVLEYGSVAVAAIENLIRTHRVNAEVASEALRWLGLMGDSAYYVERRDLLIKCLFSESARIRDGAALGLSFLEDPYAIFWVEKAMKHEGNLELRRDLHQILEELKSLR